MGRKSDSHGHRDTHTSGTGVTEFTALHQMLSLKEKVQQNQNASDFWLKGEWFLSEWFQWLDKSTIAREMAPEATDSSSGCSSQGHSP